MSDDLEPVALPLVRAPAGDLAELHSEAQEHLSYRRAEATFRAYASDWLILRAFLVSRCGVGQATLPAYDRADDAGRPVTGPWSADRGSRGPPRRLLPDESSSGSQALHGDSPSQRF